MSNPDVQQMLKEFVQRVTEAANDAARKLEASYTRPRGRTVANRDTRPVPSEVMMAPRGANLG